MIQQRGFGDKPTLSIFKPNSNEIEAEEIIVYSLENMRVYGGY